MPYQLTVVHALTGNLTETNLNPAVQIVTQFIQQDHIWYGNYPPSPFTHSHSLFPHATPMAYSCLDRLGAKSQG